jgi:hypothetical protein
MLTSLLRFDAFKHLALACQAMGVLDTKPAAHAITALVHALLVRAILGLNALAVLVGSARAVLDRLLRHAFHQMTVLAAAVAVEDARLLEILAVVARAERIDARVVAVLVCLALVVRYALVDELERVGEAERGALLLAGCENDEINCDKQDQSVRKFHCWLRV